jgi:acetyl-CoA carboxylase carboxyltransferase component
MDPVVGANVLYADQLSGLAGDARKDELYRLAAQLGADSDPRAIAAGMNLDDVIEPADTRVVLADALARFAPGAIREPSVLSSWPHWW